MRAERFASRLSAARWWFVEMIFSANIQRSTDSAHQTQTNIAVDKCSMASRNENYTILVMSAAVLVMADVNKKREDNDVGGRWRTNLFKKRSGTGILMDLKSQEISGQYKNFTRMTPTDFENLLQRIGPHISKQETYFRTPISAQDSDETGDCSDDGLDNDGSEVAGTLPKTPTAWKQVSKIFEIRWNLPHCVGALDGKHVVLQAPVKSGTEFFNYKSNFSIVLFALVDGDYNFMFADVGCQGRISDGGVFKASKLYQQLTENRLGLPTPELEGCSMQIPYFFAGDSAFALSENLMKPYTGLLSKRNSSTNFQLSFE
ncbi:unnamed protein product [Acanthoscelides obtectus]|uniref:DDE Tnp4 domain-containing protein n=1 Tax=Acanthoscelides obtectus TaxID=200917 RepID=A0A9P0PY09_ACAOB|nr:unnamed protein product [Acanthoscelides obtectus]CAK1647532.1 Protein ALP1-like [Acanthoscelides obtectus]